MKAARLNRHTFEGIAAAVKRSLDEADKVDADNGTNESCAYVGVRLCAESLADGLSEAVSQFDRALFLKNCGFDE